MASIPSSSSGVVPNTNLIVLPELTVWTAYRQTMESALQKVKPTEGPLVSRLDVAVVLDSRHQQNLSRTTSYHRYQKMLKEIYNLICVCAARCKVELDYPGGVDTRVFFLYLPDEAPTEQSDGETLCGPFVDAYAFVAARRTYKTIFSVESDQGDSISRKLIGLWRQKHGQGPEVVRLPCGPSIGRSARETSVNVASNLHTDVAVGGTFDHLHCGHKLLLTATVLVPSPFKLTSDFTRSQQTNRHITIGITGDELLVNKKYANEVESWEERQRRTAEFIESVLIFHPNPRQIRGIENIDKPGPNGKLVKFTYSNHLVINYTRISDPFGPTITDESITALIISGETRAGGKAVNDKRQEKGWAVLEVFEVDVLDAAEQEDSKIGESDQQNFDSKISSTDIRRRLANRTNGHAMM